MHAHPSTLDGGSEGGVMAEDSASTAHTAARAMLDSFSVGAVRFDVTRTTRAGDKVR
jgi:hypothetical protein